MHEDALAVFASELRALNELAGNPPRSEMIYQASKQVPPVSLTRSSLSGWFNGHSAPEPKKPIAFLLQFLHGRAVARGHTDLFGVDWYEGLRVRAWKQKSAARGGRPGKPRSRLSSDMAQELPTVLELDPLLLGVHRPIHVPGHDDSTLPPYVRRDVDHGAYGFRARMRTASRTGGFFVLVGGSSVGKSRTLYEALLAAVPNWHLFHPSSAADLTDVVESVPRRLVVWLDDLRQYVDGPSGIGAPSVRALLRRGALIVATMGSGHYADLTAQPGIDDVEDRHRGKRELFKIAHVHHLSSEFTPREWDRAETTARKSAAAGDRRLQIALTNARSGLKGAHITVSSTEISSKTSGKPKKKTPGEICLALYPNGELSAVQIRAIDWFSERLQAAQPPLLSDDSRFGLTQTMAAAPQLVERWRNADSQDMPYAWSVLAAGIDLARLGVSSPLTSELLKAAAWGYCTSEQRARATTNWFDEALTYATRQLLGATSALVPVMAGTGENEAICYRPADYLLEHVSKERYGVVPPAGFWDACAKHLTDSRDLLAVGRSAVARLRYVYAAPLLARSFKNGESEAYMPLSRILLAQQRVGELIELTRDHEDLYGKLPSFAVMHIAKDMAAHGYAKEALCQLRPYADYFLGSVLLAEICDDAAMLPELAELSSQGNFGASRDLATRFWEAGEILHSFAVQAVEAFQSIFAGTEEVPFPQLKDDQSSLVDNLLGIFLVDHPGRRGHLLTIDSDASFASGVSQFFEAAEAFRGEAFRLLDRAKGQEPKGQELHQVACCDSKPAPPDLARSLEEASDLNGARDALDPARSDQEAELMRSSLLEKHGRSDAVFEGLRSLAESGDFNSTILLSEILVESGRAEDALALLRDRDRAGDPFVFVWLDYLLARQGNVRELAARAALGDNVACERLAPVIADALVARGQQGEAYVLLRQQVDTGRKLAATDMIEWLKRHGRAEDAVRLTRWGIDADGDIAVAPASHG